MRVAIGKLCFSGAEFSFGQIVWPTKEGNDSPTERGTKSQEVHWPQMLFFHKHMDPVMLTLLFHILAVHGDLFSHVYNFLGSDFIYCRPKTTLQVRQNKDAGSTSQSTKITPSCKA
jgi:hypothetical protein